MQRPFCGRTLNPTCLESTTLVTQTFVTACFACLPATGHVQPVMHETCCPQYTIRLDVTRFKHTKGHRQVLNRLKRYLEGDNESGSSTGASGQHMPSDGKDSSAAGDGSRDSGARRKRDVSRGALQGKQDSANGDSKRGNPAMIGTLCELVAAAAVDLVEAGTVSDLDLGTDWRSEVAGWSQVRVGRRGGVSFWG